MEIKASQVYWDPRTQVIFTVKRQLKRYMVIGGCWSPYYNDAQTSYIRYRISNTYFKGCSPIDKTSHLLHSNGIGLRLRDNNQKYKTHSNPNYKYLKESQRLMDAARKKYDSPGFDSYSPDLTG